MGGGLATAWLFEGEKAENSQKNPAPLGLS